MYLVLVEYKTTTLDDDILNINQYYCYLIINYVLYYNTDRY